LIISSNAKSLFPVYATPFETNVHCNARTMLYLDGGFLPLHFPVHLRQMGRFYRIAGESRIKK
jgi:hypothetical protein